MKDVSVVVILANGYQVSIIRNKYSYGGPQGQFEIAVIKEGKFTTVKGVNNFDDPVGYLSAKEVDRIINQVAAV